MLPLALSGGGGAVVGYHVGRMSGPVIYTTVEKLAEGVLSQAALATVGPIIAAGITGGCMIVAAVAVPATVVWMLRRKE